MTERPPGDEPSTSQPLAPLPWSVRLLVLFVGGVLTAIGLAGLFLPGIQGIVTIALGMAVMSLASDRVHRQLTRLLGRWPSVHDRVERFRRRVHGWLSRGGNPDDDSD